MSSVSHHDVGHDEQWTEQLASLERDGELSAPWVDAAIAWFVERSSNRPMKHIIDAGCGPGFAVCTFAAAIPSAHISALDPTAPFLVRTRQRAAELGVGGRVSTHQGDIESMLGTLPKADLVWSSHVIHHLSDPVQALRTLGEQLAPGGLVAIAEGGLPMRVLPGGYGVGLPSFLARLEATLSDYFVNAWDLTATAISGARDWPLLMADAGLRHVASRTFLVDLPAPLDDHLRGHIVEHFRHIRELVRHRLAEADAVALDTLVDADASGSLLRRPDVFVLSAQTVHVAGLG